MKTKLRLLKARSYSFDSQCLQTDPRKSPNLRREIEKPRDTCLYPNVNPKYLVSDIAESKDHDGRENGGGCGISQRGSSCKRVQNLLLLCRIAVGKRDRHATKEKKAILRNYRVCLWTPLKVRR